MIPLLDLKAQYQSIKGEIDEAVATVFETSQFILGESVAQFEREFAAYCGTSETIAVNSGTSAIHLALLAFDVGPGDEVITVPFTFAATVAAILYAGATPVLVDIDPASYNIDPTKLEKAISKKTKAIMPVHLYGQPADMDPILEIAGRKGIPVVEDAAQAHGALYKGRRAGSLSEIACFSFYPGKNLGAAGEGGAVTTSNPDLAEKIRLLRNWGQDRKYHHLLRGFNYRMDGIQGAVLGVKLRHLEAWTEVRRKHADRYRALLKDCPGVLVPREMPYARHVYHQFTLRVSDRDAMHQALLEDGIQTGIHYPIPVHLQTAYSDLGYGEGDFPIAEQMSREVLSLPIYPEMADKQLEQVAGSVREAVQVQQA